MIYFIRNGRAIKIGYSRNVERRFREFRTSIPEIMLIGTMPGEVGHERALHKLLTEHRIDGEWFRDNEHVRTAIKSAMENGVEALEPSHRSDVKLNATAIQAQRLAEVIMRGRAKTLKDATQIFGVPSSLIIKLRYKPDNRLSVSSFRELLIAARRAITDSMRELADDLDFIDDVERADANQDNILLDLQRKISVLEDELAAREVLRSEVKLGFDPPK